MADETRSNGGGSTAATRPGPTRRPGLIRSVAHRLAGERLALPVEGRLAPFAGATRWLNSEPLTPEGLRGRVVLVDFWTYTCVNWLRTLPYVRAWAAKYAGAGLTVVGVHTPEFGFEGNVDNVIEQSRNLGVEYPVAIDNDYAVGAPSPTASGRRCTSPMPRAASGTTTSARASTPWPRWPSNSSCSRPAPRTSTRTS
jgi:thiol-disulfide isomerase/thioredoxin